MIDYWLFIVLMVSKLIYFIEVRLLPNHSLMYSFTISTKEKKNSKQRQQSFKVSDFSRVNEALHWFRP